MNTDRSTFSIRFIAQKGKCNAEGKAPILARLSVNGEMVLSKSVTQCTYQRYVLTRNRLAEFMQSKYDVDDLPLADINHSFIKGFDLHNRNRHASANNTASRFVKHFRTMFNLGLNNGWVRTDPFTGYKIRFEKVNRGFLTREEIDRLMSREFTNKRLEVVRDMFLFSAYTDVVLIHNALTVS